MALGDRKRARDEFFALLEAVLDDIADESTGSNSPAVTLHTTTDPRDLRVPIAE